MAMFIYLTSAALVEYSGKLILRSLLSVGGGMGVAGQARDEEQRAVSLYPIVLRSALFYIHVSQNPTSLSIRGLDLVPQRQDYILVRKRTRITPRHESLQNVTVHTGRVLVFLHWYSCLGESSNNRR